MAIGKKSIILVVISALVVVAIIILIAVFAAPANTAQTTTRDESGVDETGGRGIFTKPNSLYVKPSTTVDSALEENDIQIEDGKVLPTRATEIKPTDLKATSSAKSIPKLPTIGP